MFCCYRVLALYRFKGVLLALIVMGKLRQTYTNTQEVEAQSRSEWQEKATREAALCWEFWRRLEKYVSFCS